MNESASFFLILVFDVSLSDWHCIFADLLWPISHILPEKKIALFFSFEVPVPWGVFFLSFHTVFWNQLSETLVCLCIVLLKPFCALWEDFLLYVIGIFQLIVWAEGAKAVAYNLAVTVEESIFSEDKEQPRSPKFSSSGLQFSLQQVISAAVVSKGMVAEWCFLT